MFIFIYLRQIWKGTRDPNSTNGCFPAFLLDVLIAIIVVVLWAIL